MWTVSSRAGLWSPKTTAREQHRDEAILLSAAAILILFISPVTCEPGSKDWIDSPFTGQGERPANGTTVFFSCYLDRLLTVNQQDYGFHVRLAQAGFWCTLFNKVLEACMRIGRRKLGLCLCSKMVDKDQATDMDPSAGHDLCFSVMDGPTCSQRGARSNGEVPKWFSL